MTRIAIMLSQEPGPADRAVLSMAIRGMAGEVHAFTDRPSESAWRYALAAGAKDVSVWSDVSEIKFDVALIASGDDFLAASLAESVRCPLVLDVVDIERDQIGWRVTRDLGRGARQIVAVDGPVVLGITDDAPNAVYVSRYRRRAVPLPDEFASDSTPEDASWMPAKPRTRTANIDVKTAGSAADRAARLFGLEDSAGSKLEKRLVQADPATCAQYLLRYLSHHGFVDRAVGAPDSQPTPVAAEVPVAMKKAKLQKRGGGLRRPRALDGETRENAPRPVPVENKGKNVGKLSRRPRLLDDTRESATREPRRPRGPIRLGNE